LGTFAFSDRDCTASATQTTPTTTKIETACQNDGLKSWLMGIVNPRHAEISSGIKKFMGIANLP